MHHTCSAARMSSSTTALAPPTTTTCSAGVIGVKSPPSTANKAHKAGAIAAKYATPKRKTKQTRAKKPDSAPKRPLSAYNLFFKHERERMLLVAESTSGEATSGSSGGIPPLVPSTDVLAALSPRSDKEDDKTKWPTVDKQAESKRRHRKLHGRIGFKNLAAQIARKWNETNPETRAPYEEIAAKEREQYRIKLDEWKRSQGIEIPPAKKRRSVIVATPMNVPSACTSTPVCSSASAPTQSIPLPPQRSPSPAMPNMSQGSDTSTPTLTCSIPSAPVHVTQSMILPLHRSPNPAMSEISRRSDTATTLSTTSSHSASTIPIAHVSSSANEQPRPSRPTATPTSKVQVQPAQSKPTSQQATLCPAQIHQITEVLVTTVATSQDKSFVQTSCKSLFHLYCPGENGNGAKGKKILLQDYPFLLSGLERVIDIGRSVYGTDTLLYAIRMLHHLSTIRGNLDLMACSKSTIGSVASLVSLEEKESPKIHRFAVRTLVRLARSPHNRAALVKILVDYCSIATNTELKNKVKQAISKLVLMF